MRTNKKEVTIVTTCPNCGCFNGVPVNKSDYMVWQNGALIQDAFPYLNAEDREKLISGFCEDCWDALFDGEGEDNYDDYKDEDYDAGFDPYMGCYTEDC